MGESSVKAEWNQTKCGDQIHFLKGKQRDSQQLREQFFRSVVGLIPAPGETADTWGKVYTEHCGTEALLS